MPTRSLQIGTAWQEVATGPVYLQQRGLGTAVRVHIGGSVPASDADDYLVLTAGQMAYEGNETVYLRTSLKAAVVVASGEGVV